MKSDYRLLRFAFLLHLVLLTSAASKFYKKCNRTTQFQCKNSQNICIEISQVNDGIRDCPDGSDEGLSKHGNIKEPTDPPDLEDIERSDLHSMGLPKHDVINTSIFKSGGPESQPIVSTSSSIFRDLPETSVQYQVVDELQSFGSITSGKVYQTAIKVLTSSLTASQTSTEEHHHPSPEFSKVMNYQSSSSYETPHLFTQGVEESMIIVTGTKGTFLKGTDTTFNVYTGSYTRGIGDEKTPYVFFFGNKKVVNEVEDLQMAANERTVTITADPGDLYRQYQKIVVESAEPGQSDILLKMTDKMEVILPTAIQKFPSASDGVQFGSMKIDQDVFGGFVIQGSNSFKVENSTDDIGSKKTDTLTVTLDAVTSSVGKSYSPHGATSMDINGAVSLVLDEADSKTIGVIGMRMEDPRKSNHDYIKPGEVYRNDARHGRQYNHDRYDDPRNMGRRVGDEEMMIITDRFFLPNRIIQTSTVKDFFELTATDVVKPKHKESSDLNKGHTEGHKEHVIRPSPQNINDYRPTYTVTGEGDRPVFLKTESDDVDMESISFESDGLTGHKEGSRGSLSNDDIRSTITLFGFADFTTTMPGTVMIFQPSTVNGIQRYNVPKSTSVQVRNFSKSKMADKADDKTESFSTTTMTRMFVAQKTMITSTVSDKVEMMKKMYTSTIMPDFGHNPKSIDPTPTSTHTEATTTVSMPVLKEKTTEKVVKQDSESTEESKSTKVFKEKTAEKVVKQSTESIAESKSTKTFMVTEIEGSHTKPATHTTQTSSEVSKESSSSDILNIYATQNYGTGLISSSTGLDVNHETTTHWTTLVYGTYIGSRYAQVIQSTSSIYYTLSKPSINPEIAVNFIDKTEVPLAGSVGHSQYIIDIVASVTDLSETSSFAVHVENTESSDVMSEQMGSNFKVFEATSSRTTVTDSFIIPDLPVEDGSATQKNTENIKIVTDGFILPKSFKEDKNLDSDDQKILTDGFFIPAQFNGGTTEESTSETPELPLLATLSETTTISSSPISPNEVEFQSVSLVQPTIADAPFAQLLTDGLPNAYGGIEERVLDPSFRSERSYQDLSVAENAPFSTNVLSNFETHTEVAYPNVGPSLSYPVTYYTTFTYFTTYIKDGVFGTLTQESTSTQVIRNSAEHSIAQSKVSQSIRPTNDPTTFYTTYTYYTTYLDGESTRVVSNLETVSKVVAPKTYFVQSTEKIPQVRPTDRFTTEVLPTTYYANYTYFTTIVEGTSTVVKSNIQVKSEVVTRVRPDQSAHVIRTSVDINPFNTQRPATYYTTFTHFTTVLNRGVTEVITRRETETNVHFITNGFTRTSKINAIRPTSTQQTYYTTYTYLTTIPRDGSSYVVTQKETITNYEGQPSSIVPTYIDRSSDIPIQTDYGVVQQPGGEVFTYYTTYTYYTTKLIAGTRQVDAVKQTFSNVVRQTTPIQIISTPPVILPTPIDSTVYTTYTHFTTSLISGSQVVNTRKEIVTSVLRNKGVLPQATHNDNRKFVLSTQTVYQNGVPFIRTRTYYVDGRAPTATSLGLRATSTIGDNQQLTHYTTYTYFTTYPYSTSSIVVSSVETISRVVPQQTQVPVGDLGAIIGRKLLSIEEEEDDFFVIDGQEEFDDGEDVFYEVTPTIPPDQLQLTGVIQSETSKKVNNGTTTVFGTETYGTYIEGEYAHVVETKVKVYSHPANKVYKEEEELEDLPQAEKLVAQAAVNVPVVTEAPRPIGIISSEVESFVIGEITSFFTTNIIGTYVGGIYAHIAQTTTSVSIGPTEVKPTSSQNTGLVKSSVVTEVNDGTSTLHTTEVYGTFIQGFYAHIASSSSRIVLPVEKPIIEEEVTTVSNNIEPLLDILPTPAQDEEKKSLISSDISKEVNSGVTTLHTTNIYQTLIGGYYAEIAESISEIISAEKVASSEIKPPDIDPTTSLSLPIQPFEKVITQEEVTTVSNNIEPLVGIVPTPAQNENKKLFISSEISEEVNFGVTTLHTKNFYKTLIGGFYAEIAESTSKVIIKETSSETKVTAIDHTSTVEDGSTLVSSRVTSQVNGDSTTFFTTHVYGTFIGGIYAQIAKTTSTILSNPIESPINSAAITPVESNAIENLSIEEEELELSSVSEDVADDTVEDVVDATVKEEKSTGSQLGNGLISENLFSTNVNDGTSTVYISQIHSTYIGGFFAHVAKVTSTVIAPTAIKPILLETSLSTTINDGTTTIYTKEAYLTEIDGLKAQVVSTKSRIIQPTSSSGPTSTNGIISSDINSVVNDGTTTVYTTEIHATRFRGFFAHVAKTKTSIIEPTLSTTKNAPNFKEGLVSVGSTSSVNDDTTTYYTSSIYGTFINGFYAHIQRSNSRTEYNSPTQTSQVIVPTSLSTVTKSSTLTVSSASFNEENVIDDFDSTSNYEKKPVKQVPEGYKPKEAKTTPEPIVNSTTDPLPNTVSNNNNDTNDYLREESVKVQATEKDTNTVEKAEQENDVEGEEESGEKVTKPKVKITPLRRRPFLLRPNGPKRNTDFVSRRRRPLRRPYLGNRWSGAEESEEEQLKDEDEDDYELDKSSEEKEPEEDKEKLDEEEKKSRVKIRPIRPRGRARLQNSIKRFRRPTRSRQFGRSTDSSKVAVDRTALIDDLDEESEGFEDYSEDESDERNLGSRSKFLRSRTRLTANKRLFLSRRRNRRLKTNREDEDDELQLTGARRFERKPTRTRSRRRNRGRRIANKGSLNNLDDKYEEEEHRRRIKSPTGRSQSRSNRRRKFRRKPTTPPTKPPPTTPTKTAVTVTSTFLTIRTIPLNYGFKTSFATITASASSLSVVAPIDYTVIELEDGITKTLRSSVIRVGPATNIFEPQTTTIAKVFIETYTLKSTKLITFQIGYRSRTETVTKTNILTSLSTSLSTIVPTVTSSPNQGLPVPYFPPIQNSNVNFVTSPNTYVTTETVLSTAVVPINVRGKTVMRTITKTLAKKAVTKTRTVPVNGPTPVPFQQGFQQPLYPQQYQRIYQQQYQQFQYYPGLQAQPQPQHLVNRYLPPYGQQFAPPPPPPVSHQKVARSAKKDGDESIYNQLHSSGLEGVQPGDFSSIRTETLGSAKNFDGKGDRVTTIFQDANTEIYEQSASEPVKSAKEEAVDMNDVDEKFGIGSKYQKRKLQQFRTLDNDFLSFQAVSTPEVDEVQPTAPQTANFFQTQTFQQQPPRNQFQQPRNPFQQQPRRGPRRQRPIQNNNQPFFQNDNNDNFRPTEDFQSFPGFRPQRFNNFESSFDSNPRPTPVDFNQRPPVQGPRRGSFNGPRRVTGPRRQTFGAPRRVNPFTLQDNVRQRPTRRPEIITANFQSPDFNRGRVTNTQSIFLESSVGFNNNFNVEDNFIPNTADVITSRRPSITENTVPPRRRIRLRPGQTPNRRRPLIVSSVRRPSAVPSATPASPQFTSPDPITTPTFGIRNDINGPRRITIRRTRPVNNGDATDLPPNRRRVVTRRPQRVRTKIPIIDDIESNNIGGGEDLIEKPVKVVPPSKSSSVDASSSKRKVTIRRTRPAGSGPNQPSRFGVRRVVVTKSKSKVDGEVTDNELPTPVATSEASATPINDLLNKPLPLTYYTTYTYFTTFIRGDNTLYTSREAFFNNVITKTLEPSVASAIKNNDGYTVEETDVKPISLATRTRENIATIVNLGSRVQVLNSDVKNAIFATQAINQPASSIQTFQSKAVDDLLAPEADLDTMHLNDLAAVPKTYFTQFTYYYTFYDALSTRMSAREETYSNIVTDSSNFLTASFSDKINNEGLLTVGPTAQIVNLGSRTIDGTTTEVNLGLQTVLKFDGISNVVIKNEIEDTVAPTKTFNIQPTKTADVNQLVTSQPPTIFTPFLEGSFSESSSQNQASTETPAFETPTQEQFSTPSLLTETDSAAPTLSSPSVNAIPEDEAPTSKRTFVRSRIYRPDGSLKSNVLSVDPSFVVKDGKTRRRIKVAFKRPSPAKETLQSSSFTRFVKPKRIEFTSKSRFSITSRPNYNTFSKPTRRRKTLKVTRRPGPSTPTPSVILETYTTLVTVPVVFGLDTSFREAMLTLTRSKENKPAPTRAIKLTYYTTTTYTIPVLQDDATIYSFSEEVNSRVVTRTIVGSATSSQSAVPKISSTPVPEVSFTPSMSTVVSTIGDETITFTYFLTEPVETQDVTSSLDFQQSYSPDQTFVPSVTPTIRPSEVYDTSEKTVIKTEYTTSTFFATLFNGTRQIVTPIEEVQSSIVTATETYTIVRTDSPTFVSPSVPQLPIVPSEVSYTTRTELNTITNVVTFFQGDSTIVTSLQDVITNIVTEPVVWQPTIQYSLPDVSYTTTVVPIVDTITTYNTQTHVVTLFSGTDTITSSITEVNSEVFTETVDYSTKTVIPTQPADIFESIQPFTYIPPAITATATIDGRIVTTVISADGGENTPEVPLSTPVFYESSPGPEVDTVVKTFTYFNTFVDEGKTIVTSSEELSTQYITKTTPPIPYESSEPIDESPSETVKELYITQTQLTTNTFTFTLFNGSETNVITSEQISTQFVTDTIRSTLLIPTETTPAIAPSSASAVPSSVLSFSTTYTYYTTTVIDSRTLLTSSEEVITKYVTLDQPIASNTVNIQTTDLIVEASSTFTTDDIVSSSPTVDSTQRKVPLTTIIDGNQVVFFTDSPILASTTESVSSTPTGAAPVTSIIDDSTIVFYTGVSDTEVPSKTAVPTPKVTTTETTTTSTPIPVLKPFTSVINGATIIVFKEVFEDESTSTTTTESSVVPETTTPEPSSTFLEESSEPVSSVMTSVEETPEPSASLKILSGSSAVFFTSSTETTKESSDSAEDTSTAILESSVETTSESTSSESETPELTASNAKPLSFPNIVTSVLGSATTFVGSNGKTTSAAASATLIFITGTDGNVLTLMPATLATTEVKPTETTQDPSIEATEAIIPSLTVVPDVEMVSNLPNVTESSTDEEATTEYVEEITTQDTTELDEITFDVPTATPEAEETTEEITEGITEGVTEEVTEAVTKKNVNIAPNFLFPDSVTELSPDITTKEEEYIRPIFLDPYLLPSLNTESKPTKKESSDSVKTDIITGATTLFIDIPKPSTSSDQTDTKVTTEDSSSDVDSIINTSAISSKDHKPQPLETIFTGATTVFGGVLFTRPSIETSTTEEQSRPAFTRPVFNPFQRYSEDSTESSKPTDALSDSVVETQYITMTESITRTLTLSTTSIYYTKGSPLTITQFYTTTIAPRTIVSTIIGDQTILGTTRPALSTQATTTEPPSNYEATPVTTTVTTTTLIFNSITTTVVRTLVIPTIDPTKIDFNEATEINDIGYNSRVDSGRSNNLRGEIREQVLDDGAAKSGSSSNEDSTVQPIFEERPPNPVQYPSDNEYLNEINKKPSMCVPECNYANHEICKKVGNIWKCDCRPGFARTDKLQVCEATQAYTVLLRVVKMKESAIKYSTDYSDSQSNGYQDFSNKIKDGIDRAYSKSKVSNNYLGADIMDLKDGKSLNNSGVLVNFTVNVAKDAPVSASLLKEELYKSLQSTNYSIGGTDLYVQPYIQSIENVTDFDECSHFDFNDCADNAYCFNTRGSYECKCKDETQDLSDPQFPGRVCAESNTACKFCNSHGVCYKKPDGRDGCRCYYWYLGERCEINGRLLVIVLPIVLIVVLIAILCAVCCCLKKRSKKQKKMATNNMFVPYPGYAGTLDRKAMIPETSSESSVGKGSQFTPVSSAFRKIVGLYKSKGSYEKTKSDMNSRLDHSVPSVTIPRPKVSPPKSSSGIGSGESTNQVNTISVREDIQKEYSSFAPVSHLDFKKAKLSSKNFHQSHSDVMEDKDSKSIPRTISEGQKSYSENTLNHMVHGYHHGSQFSQNSSTAGFVSDGYRDNRFSTPSTFLGGHSHDARQKDYPPRRNTKSPKSISNNSQYHTFYNDTIESSR